MNHLQSAVVPQLYLLTNDDEFERLYQKLEVALATGLVGLLQVRRKKTAALPDGAATLLAEAKQIVELARRYQVPVVINDDSALAAKLGVGVHLGQQDGKMVDAKRQISPDQIIGRTCHGQVALVKEAKQQGADYAAMGAVFASTTKPKADTISYQQLKEGCQQGIDICVIGGLSAENVGALAGLPIKYVAVVGDIMDLPVAQIAPRCQQWQQAFAKWHAAAGDVKA
ncbi:thiamine phosphate synthase [Psychrobacter celer]|uniref:thiamine phosphate synthase n=1 Tax=Psychrobacter celer TaxID=306572 RepID=UPI003FD04B6D